VDFEGDGGGFEAGEGRGELVARGDDFGTPAEALLVTTSMLLPTAGTT
jgi:hypothetical protein